MNKKLFLVFAVISAVLLFGMYEIYFRERGADSYKDATYLIGGREVALKNGKSEIEDVPGSASRVVTTYFGNEASYDFDGDGREDAVFLVSQDSGGSGTFYYVVAALNTKDGYFGTNGVLLGDRIAPQTTQIADGGLILVNYADRRANESFAVKPSIGKTMRLVLDPQTRNLAEILTGSGGASN